VRGLHLGSSNTKHLWHTLAVYFSKKSFNKSTIWPENCQVSLPTQSQIKIKRELRNQT